MPGKNPFTPPSDPGGPPDPEISLPNPAFTKFIEAKVNAIQAILGPMSDTIAHPRSPAGDGGSLDIYYFPEALPGRTGTALATLDLIRPDGSGPRAATLGTYEVVAFTRQAMEASQGDAPFNKIERKLWYLLSMIGMYGFEAELNPLQTAGIPGPTDQRTGKAAPNSYLIFDEYRRPGVDFHFDGKFHGLLLLIEVHEQEMAYAQRSGVPALLQRLKSAGAYPFSDLDRKPVV